MGLAENALSYLMDGDQRLGKAPTPLDLDIFREYVRRMAIWTTHFAKTSSWLFSDLHSAIAKNYDYRFWPEVAPSVRAKYAFDWEIAIERILKFYELEDTLGILQRYRFPDPYEPLLFLLANDRLPIRTNGSYEIGCVSVCLTMSQAEYALCEPFVNMSKVYQLPQLSEG